VGTLVPSPFRRTIAPDERDPAIVELVLSEEVKTWLAQKVQEKEEPTEILLQDLGRSVQHLKDAYVATHTWTTQVGEWQQGIIQIITRHENWTPLLEQMAEHIQHLNAAMSDVYPTVCWSLRKISGFEETLRKSGEAHQNVLEQVQLGQGQSAQLQLEVNALENNLAVISTAVTENSHASSSNFTTLTTRVDGVEREVLKCETEIQKMKLSAVVPSVSLDPEFVARLQGWHQELGSLTARVSALEGLSLQLAERRAPPGKSMPVASLSPEECRQMCVAEIRRELASFVNTFDERMVQHVTHQVRQEITQIGVGKDEYRDDRAFTDKALDTLQTDLEELREQFQAFSENFWEENKPEPPLPSRFRKAAYHG
jgi:chromosome segregation ATPase